MDAPQFVRIPSLLSQSTATVIFVPGLGDSTEGVQAVAERIRRDPATHHIEWILPQSPIRKVTANAGLEMPSWYDIYAYGLDVPEDQSGMLQSASSLKQLIASIIERGVPPHRIVIGGFSQGGTISFLTGLTGSHKLAGIVNLSGWLPLQHRFSANASTHPSPKSVFYGHGDQDTLVSRELFQRSADILTHQLGIPSSSGDSVNGLTYNVYRGLNHDIDEERELPDLIAWFTKVLPS